MKNDLLERLIEDRLILQEAKKNNISTDQNRIKARINEIRQHYATDADFQNELKKQGLVQADIETKISDQMLMYDIIDQKIRKLIIIRPDEVTDFYNNNKKDFLSGEQRELRVITFDNKDLANTFYSDLKSGQKLEDLASRDQLTVDKLNVTHRGEFKKEIEDIIFKLNLSETSEPLALDSKFYIFELEKIIPSKQLTLSEVQDKIHAYLFEKKMQEELTKWLDELKKQSYIKILQG
jgi:parvulin-like peptidyl-prolyl isomerase